jgi:hypothetical protein
MRAMLSCCAGRFNRREGLAPGRRAVVRSTAMADDSRTESGKSAARARREARLAAALRLNLKRRKAAAKGGRRPPGSAEPEPESAPSDRPPGRR